MSVQMMVKNWRAVIRPHRIEIEDDLTDSHGRFECAPLERGFGLTLGNALRRVLLSSLQGSAITSVRIGNVMHEFTTVAGVLEDVTDIVLNLKEIRLRLNAEGPKELTLQKRGPGKVTAADFLSPDQTVDILDSTQPIATLSEDAELDLVATVERGKGFILAERSPDDEQPLGTIPMDAVFSPVQRVNYTVTNARVGRSTDYDKLIIEIWTDGSVSPADALAFGAKILKEQLSVFINFEEDIEQTLIEGPRAIQPNEVLYRPVEELELSVRSANCLQNAEIRYVGELVQKTEAEMLRTKNFGRKSLNEIKEILDRLGLDFGMVLDGFPARKELDRVRGLES